MRIRPLSRRTAAARRAAFTLLEVLVVVAILVVLAGVSSIYVFRYLDDAKKDKAKIDIRAIEQAIKAYSLRNEGQPPQSLEQLVVPPDGSRPFLEGGAAAVTDPWGKMYQYQIGVGGEGNEERPYVFTNAPDGTLIASAK